jgi:N-sulfoglucosamine sulfohydrolase
MKRWIVLIAGLQAVWLQTAHGVDTTRAAARPAGTPVINSDTDSFSNAAESRHGTDPLHWDTDGDKVPDDIEVSLGLNPLEHQDDNDDGLPDDWQAWIAARYGPGSSGLSADPDRDGLTNQVEFQLGTSPVTSKRHIIIFMAEDQGYDWSGAGTAGLSTPALETLAARGVSFSRAFAAASVCSPSKMSLYTGLYPHQHSGVRNVPNSGVAFPLDRDTSNLVRGGIHEDLPTLVEIFSSRGWHSAITLKTHVQPLRKFPFAQGFEPQEVATPIGVSRVVKQAFEAATDRPLFLLVNVAGPHLPFRMLPRANGTWSDRGGLVGDGTVLEVENRAIEVPEAYPDLPAVRQDFTDYLGAIQVVDAMVGETLKTLERLGEIDSTLLIYTSDHGMGLHRAKQSIYAAGLHVPLILSGPGIAESVQTATPVTHLDLTPTLLDYAEIPVMEHYAGRTLWPVLSGRASTIPDRTTVMLSNNDKYDARAVTDGRHYYIRNLRQPTGGRLKVPEFPAKSYADSALAPALNDDQYDPRAPWFNRTFLATVSGGPSPQRELLRQLVEGDMPEEELYDLAADPSMVRNLVADPDLRRVRAELRGELTRWRLATSDTLDDSRKLKRRTRRIPPPDQLAAERPCPAPPNAPWETVLCNPDNEGFTQEGEWFAPPHALDAMAISTDRALPDSGDWRVSVETKFVRSGVIGGLVFGYRNPDNHFRLELQDVRGARTGRWHVRLIEKRNAVETVRWIVEQGAEGERGFRIRNDTVYRLTVSYDLVHERLNFGLRATDTDGRWIFQGHWDGSESPAGAVGIYASTSAASRFRHLRVSGSPGSSSSQAQ